MKSSVRHNIFRIARLPGPRGLGGRSARAELVAHPKQAGTSIDLGQAFKDDGKTPLTRTGVYLTTGGVYDKKFEVLVTLGGLFWYGFPELATNARLVRFGPGVGQAQAIYSFGDPEAADRQTQSRPLSVQVQPRFPQSGRVPVPERRLSQLYLDGRMVLSQLLGISWPRA